jgi:hypothetical protein
MHMQHELRISGCRSDRSISVAIYIHVNLQHVLINGELNIPFVTLQDNFEHARQLLFINQTGERQ